MTSRLKPQNATESASPAGPVNIYMQEGYKSKALVLAEERGHVDPRGNPSIAALFRALLDDALEKPE